MSALELTIQLDGIDHHVRLDPHPAEVPEQEHSGAIGVAVIDGRELEWGWNTGLPCILTDGPISDEDIAIWDRIETAIAVHLSCIHYESN